MKLMWTLFVGALLPFALTAIEIEAEGGILTDVAASVVKSEKASGGKTVRLKGSAARKAIMKAPEEGEEPALTLKTTFAKDGKYKIIAVIYAATTSSDSCFWALDDNKPKDFHTGFPKAGVPFVLYNGAVKAGDHQIKFWTREPGFEIDKVIIEEAK